MPLLIRHKNQRVVDNIGYKSGKIKIVIKRYVIVQNNQYNHLNV